MKQSHLRPRAPLGLKVILVVLTIATLLAAPVEILHWYQYFPWWWVLNACSVYTVSLVGLYGVYRFRAWGFWLSVGSTLAAPLYLRPNDHTLMTLHGAAAYIGLYGSLIGIYWYLIIKNWKLFS